MTAIFTEAEAYLGGLNTLTKKIWSDIYDLRRTYAEEWDACSVEQQEELIDKYFCGSETTAKYSSYSRSDELPECFPNLKINSGEKIVVDFENEDGWTWRDEHSGPFSWATRSQQDLTLLDIDGDDGLEADGTPVKGKGKLGRKSRSPERAPNVAFKPENGSWDSPFLSSKGASGHLEGPKSEVEEMFRKFGIAVESNKDKAEPEKPKKVATEETKLLSDTSPEHENKAFVLNDSFTETEATGDDSLIYDVDTNTLTLDVQPAWESLEADKEITEGKSKKKKEKAVSKKRSSYKKKPEAEEALIDELSITVGSAEEDPGQVSPVYIEDPGESTTDYDFSGSVFTAPADDCAPSSQAGYDQDVATAFAEPVLDDIELRVNTTDNQSQDSKDSNAMKSGFDFLDNW